MPYKFLNFEADTFDDDIEKELNAEERDGWAVVEVIKYDSGHLKVLVHRD